MTPVEKIRQRRWERERAARMRAFEARVQENREREAEFKKQMAEMEERSQTVSFLTQFICGAPMFFGQEAYDRHMEVAERMANEAGISLSPVKTKLRAVS